MNILMVAAEVAPYSTVGGLSQVVYFLTNALIKKGHDVRVFTPKYGIISPKKPFTEKVHHLHVPTGYPGKKHPRSLICNVVTNQVGSPPTYFLENREYYELRRNVYQYKDDHIRFFLLSRGCLEWLKHQRQTGGWTPDLIHIHDWHTSYLAEDVRHNPTYQEHFHHIPVLLTVHNFHLQGPISYQYLRAKDRDNGLTPLANFFHPRLIKQNPLLRGIIHADWINTVSETHSTEVLTNEYGEGLQQILAKYRGKLSGILNGLDTKEFNPGTDPLIKHNYTKSKLPARARNKEVLQKAFRLPQNKHTPIIAYSGRLSQQKGIHHIISLMPHLIANTTAQIIILGGGDNQYRRELQKLSNTFPKRIGIHMHADFKLPRLIFAGTDILMLPSQFEPGGIVAIESLRYGAIPVVRNTGGLSDIVTDFNPATKTGTGFRFEQDDPWSFFTALIRALETHRNPPLWSKLIKNAMSTDFSWDYVANEYDALYQRVRRQRQLLIKTNPHPARFPSI